MADEDALFAEFLGEIKNVARQNEGAKPTDITPNDEHSTKSGADPRVADLDLPGRETTKRKGDIEAGAQAGVKKPRVAAKLVAAALPIKSKSGGTAPGIGRNGSSADTSKRGESRTLSPVPPPSQVAASKKSVTSSQQLASTGPSTTNGNESEKKANRAYTPLVNGESSVNRGSQDASGVAEQFGTTGLPLPVGMTRGRHGASTRDSNGQGAASTATGEIAMSNAGMPVNSHAGVNAASGVGGYGEGYSIVGPTAATGVPPTGMPPTGIPPTGIPPGMYPEHVAYEYSGMPGVLAQESNAAGSAVVGVQDHGGNEVGKGAKSGNGAKSQGSNKYKRVAGGKTWHDETLSEWPENDYRLFVGDLGNEVGDEHLAGAFRQYASFAKAKVIREKWNKKSKGYGFVSFLDGMDMLKALREQNGKYLGNRPMKISKSSWRDRDVKEVKKKAKKAKKVKKALGLL